MPHTLLQITIKHLKQMHDVKKEFYHLLYTIYRLASEKSLMHGIESLQYTVEGTNFHFYPPKGVPLAIKMDEMR